MHETENDYIRLWAEQLLKEHHRICWQHRVLLTTPLIEIGSAQGYWGKWWPTRKTIVISTKLIRRHSWEVVLNVFRHEMAHQLVSETHGQTSAHGDHFQIACERLGVPPEYRRSGGDLSEPTPLPDPNRNDRNKTMLDKVRKLLALAESANEHEALLAMNKARELIEQHGLATAENTNEYCTLVVNLGSKRVSSQHRAIASILIEHFQVEVILATTFDATTCTNYKCLDIIGRPGQVKVAEYIFHFLENRLESLWECQRKTKTSHGKTGKNSYRLGVLKGFREKLAAQKSAPKNGPGLIPASVISQLPVVQINLERDRFLANRYPRLRSTRGRSVSIDHEQYQAGQEDGRRLELRAGLSRAESSTILSLPGSA